MVTERAPQPVPPLVLELLSRLGPSSTPAGPAAGPEWERIPEGRRNSTLAAFGGTFRKQGMQLGTVYALLKSINKALCIPPLADAEVQVIARSVSRYDSDPNVDSVTIVSDELVLLDGAAMGEPPPKTWLWHPYIPDNTLTLVSGREGIGKGLFCAWVASQIMRGDVLDDEEIGREPKPVLWLTAEDHPHYDIWPRLRAVGWNPGEHATVKFVDPRQLIVLPADMEALRSTVESGEYGLVVYDPGKSYIGTKTANNLFSYNNESDIRPALQQLIFMHAELSIPGLFVAHHRKGEGPMSDATSGSLAWKQVVRHGLDFAEVEDDHALWVGKANHGKKGYVRAYTLPEVEERQTARFEVGELESDSTLDAWLKRKRESGVTIDLQEWVDRALDWASGYGLDPGGPFPVSKSLMEFVPEIPKPAHAALYERLTAMGCIRKIRGGYEWLGAPEELEA